MQTVFVLQHLHVISEDSDNIKLIGVYSSRAAAEEAVIRLQDKPGFCDYPEIRDPLVDDEEDGFYIGEYVLDKDHWETGFVTWLPDDEP